MFSICLPEVTDAYRATLVVLLVLLLSYAIVIDCLLLQGLKRRRKHTTVRTASHQRNMFDQKDIEALISATRGCERWFPRSPILYGVLLIFTKLTAFPAWLCVRLLELEPPVLLARVKSQLIPELAAAVPKADAYCQVFLFFSFMMLPSAGIFALLLVAKRSNGLQRTMIFVAYSLSATLGVLFWTFMGLTEVDTFTVFMPLMMSVAASLGLYFLTPPMKEEVR